MTVRELIRRQPKVPTSTGPDEATVRLARRDFRRRRRASGWRRRWRSVLALVLVVALVAGAVWAVWFSPYLTARDTQVDGAGAIGAERVVSVAAVPQGVPLARIDLDAVRRDVEQIPAVEGAEVSRSWPRTVRIQVTPRTPVAVVAGADAPQVIDAAGVRFTPSADALRGLPQVEVAAGVEGRALGEALVEVGQVVAALPADLARRTATVRVGSVDEISLVLRSGRTVVWGSAEQSATKAEVLGVLLGQVRRDVEEIDVSVPGRPTTR